MNALLSLSSDTVSGNRQTRGSPPSVTTAASLFQTLCYQNKDRLSAGIIVAGWDNEVGPSVYNIPLGGGLFRQPWAIGGTSRGIALRLSLTKAWILGSGSTYVYGYCDATYREGWGRDETVEFVKNSMSAFVCPSAGDVQFLFPSARTCNVSRWFFRRCYSHVCHH